MLGGFAVSAFQIAELAAAGRPFDTRNASASLRVINGKPASHLRDVTQVTDSESADVVKIASRNTAEEAFERVNAALGLPKADAAMIAGRDRKSESRKGLICNDCGHEHLPGETIYYCNVSTPTLFGRSLSKVSFCENCNPGSWNTEYADCDICNRTVYYPYRNIERRHVFCSEKCERDHYSTVQREKRLRARQKECNECGKAFTAPRSDTKFCTTTCKQKAYRARQAERQAQ